MTSVRVLLIDEDDITRAGLRALLAGFCGMEVVAEASDVRKAVELVAAHVPDLVLMNISMRNLNSLQAIASVSKQYPTVRVIILSAHANENHVLQSLRAGSSGYLLKNASAEELELAIRSVNNGGTYLSPAVTKRLTEAYLRHTADIISILDLLTLRQREVLQHIAEGKNVKAIAELLGVSVKTIETHRAQLMDRLDIHDVAGLVRFAVRTGLISADS